MTLKEGVPEHEGALPLPLGDPGSLPRETRWLCVTGEQSPLGA